MSEGSPIQPTPEQIECAGCLIELLSVGVPYADALAVIRLVARDGNTARAKTIGVFVRTGIPFDEAERFADDPGMCVALLAQIHQSRAVRRPGSPQW